MVQKGRKMIIGPQQLLLIRICFFLMMMLINGISISEFGLIHRIKVESCLLLMLVTPIRS